jgi:hypothetical protein
LWLLWPLLSTLMLLKSFLFEQLLTSSTAAVFETIDLRGRGGGGAGLDLVLGLGLQQDLGPML